MKPRAFQSTILAAAFALGACASAPMEELASADAAVASATPAGNGVAELARAQAKLTLGRRLIDAQVYGPARWALEQAQVDAELALERSAAEHAVRKAAASAPSQTAAGRIPASSF